ncbi:protein of unknown function [Candidatus Nitrospira inopinata]|uniref:Uncharacterized protein n=1 Tax=Candidatus Nitrospira inopinata TaxID=1715989 RepID=A0A0S4KNU9_9BACT|nr:protein of unknown function [Candidatus Nitrospira inopinata]
MSSPKGKKVQPVAHRDRNAVPIVAKCHGTGGVLAKLYRPVEGSPLSAVRQRNSTVFQNQRIDPLAAIDAPPARQAEPGPRSFIATIKADRHHESLTTGASPVVFLNPTQETAAPPLWYGHQLRSLCWRFLSRSHRYGMKSHRTERACLPLLGNVLKRARYSPGVFQGWEVLSPPNEGRRSHQRRCRCPLTRD